MVPDKDEAYIEEVARRKSIGANLDWLRDNLEPVKVIYSDIDGTLVGPLGCFFRDSGWGLTLRPARALVAALARNVDVMLVSGRHKSQLREIARVLGCSNYVAELGTELVYDLGMEVVMNLGDFYVDSGSVYEAVLDTGVVDLLIGHYPGKLEMHSPWSDDRDCTPLLRGLIDLEEAHALLEENSLGYFQIVDNGVIPRKSPALDVAETRAYHVVPVGVSKKQAVLKDQEHRGISRAATVAVGDAVADLPIADAVGAFFMVRNGLQANPHVAEEVEGRQNVFVTGEQMGLGWAEVTETLLAL